MKYSLVCFILLLVTSCMNQKQVKVLYTELTPREFRERIQQAPVAYLPLGTLEWHGEHLPLGSDGLQSYYFFQELAREAGGIVLPMLFLGPDRIKQVGDKELYGMDFCTLPPGHKNYYETQQLAGSAYRIEDSLFVSILDATLKQLSRAGFRIVVGHGHGPSTGIFQAHTQEWKDKYGLKLINCWGSEWDSEGKGIMVDHAAMNETSLVMAFRPELVQMQNLPADSTKWPVGVGGKDPRKYASAILGKQIIKMNKERMISIIKDALAEAP